MLMNQPLSGIPGGRDSDVQSAKLRVHVHYACSEVMTSGFYCAAMTAQAMDNAPIFKKNEV